MSRGKTVWKTRLGVRRAIVSAAVMLLASSVAGCGGEGMPSGVVAQVAGHSITKTTLERWIKAQAVMDWESHPKHAAPAGVVPDPSDYAPCVAYLGKSSRREGNRPPSDAQLEVRCRQRYEALREEALNILITFQWIIGECARRGIKVTDAEVRQEYARFNGEKFPHRGELENFLRYTGWSEADDKLSLKMDLLYAKLEQKVGGPQAFVKFIGGFTERWVARTDCRKEDVVSNCRQYKGKIPHEPRV